ncbi:MAG: CRTAC1 family protein [Myxococcales bacterium]|jgi:hypothetical protein|nr:CRTAC1 family protein [Myxococcales bacterium]
MNFNAVRLPLLACLALCLATASSACSSASSSKANDPCAACAPHETCDEATAACLCGAERCAVGWRCDAEAIACRLDLPERCVAGTSWQPGLQAFQEATDAKGLTGIEGVRLSSADLDADGFPELVVRRGGANPDDFAEGGVRHTWLLKNERGERFTDITEDSGLLRRRDTTEARRGRPAELVVFADIDNDGDLDAFTAFTQANLGETDSAELMFNRGDGRFVFGSATTSLRAAGERVTRASAAFTDVDRDGVIDLWIGNGAVNGSPRQNQLFRGDVESNFVEITREAGLTTRAWSSIAVLDAAEAHTNTWGVTACDLSGDGIPELLAASYGRAPNHMWLGTLDPDSGSVAFENRSIASDYAFDNRADWSDNESARCWCARHPEAEGCAGVPEPQYIQCQSDSDAFRWTHSTDRNTYRLGGNSGTTVCADLDGDGRLDLVTTEIVHWDVGASSDPSEALYNQGNASDGTPLFDRPGNEVTGLVKTPRDRIDWNDGDMTAAVFDFDNDGRLDIYIGSSDYPGTRGWLYWQRPDRAFEAVPIADGIDMKASHGITVADFDGDGDLDVVVGHSRARCEDQCYATPNVRYFENVLGQDGNWLQLQLEGGEGTNRAAIGARVTVRTPDGGQQTREIGGGHGHYGLQDDLLVHFGLGSACSAEVEIRWPDRALSVQRLTLAAGYRYRVLQGALPEVVTASGAP